MRLLLALAGLLPGCRGSGVVAHACWGWVSQDVCRQLRLRGSTEIYTSLTYYLALDRDTGFMQVWGWDRMWKRKLSQAVDVHVIDAGGNFLLWNSRRGILECAIDEDLGRGLCIPRKQSIPRVYDVSGYTNVYAIWGSILLLNTRTGEHRCEPDGCSSPELAGTEEVYSTSGAFLAMDRSTGKVQCWGEVNQGGGCSGTVPEPENVKIFSSRSGFLAWNRQTGWARYWGLQGSSDNASLDLDLSAFTHLSQSANAFAAWNGHTSEVRCFGYEYHGGNCSGIDFAGTTDVFGGDHSGMFLALNRRTGDAKCWGSAAVASSCPGESLLGVATVQGNFESLVAVYKDPGRVRCWGVTFSAKCSHVEAQVPGVGRLYGTDQSFLAIAAPPVQPAQPAQPEPRPGSLQWLLLPPLLGGAGLAAAIAIALWWRCAAARSWDPVQPLPPATADRVRELRARSDGLREAGGGATLLGSWRRSTAKRAGERADRLLARAALQAAGGPEHWGMSVGQLLIFHDAHRPALERYCGCHLRARDFAHVCSLQPCPLDHGTARHRQLLPGEDAESIHALPCDMFLVVDLLVKPLTQDHGGILGFWAQENLQAPRRVETFVCHCWNQPFADLLATLRTLWRETTVWVSSFALPLNIDIRSVIGSDIHRFPFARALACAERVLLAVDDSVEPLHRSWCCFELYMATVKHKRLDIRAPVTSYELYQRIQASVNCMDIRMSFASNPDDQAAIMRAIQGMEDAVNSQIRECVEDTLQFIALVVP